MSVLGRAELSPGYLRQILLVDKAWDFGTGRCFCSLAVVDYCFARVPLRETICKPLLDKQHAYPSAGVTIPGEIDFGRAFCIEQGSDTLDFGEAGLLDALVFQP